MKKNSNILANYLLHGGDYNPEQWLDYPEILQKDLVLMKQARTNTFSVGIFAWAQLEPEEGVFDFSWMDKIMNDIYQNGGRVILATPSGARPAWLSKKYPEVLRVSNERVQQLHGGRHNHCFTSLIYRQKVQIINRKLTLRYKDHPALLMWHVSNEYGGECHCDQCQDAFRRWLKKKYQTLTTLNHEWWGPFWSHQFTEWSQIQSPSVIGENSIHGLNLDWKRFVTSQTIDFYQQELIPLRELTPHIPVTTNFMSSTVDLLPFKSLDYSQFAKHVDILSWDCYPTWHNDWESLADTAMKVGFINDLYRSLKGQSFLILECTPSVVNVRPINRAKRPGVHLLSSVQFLAHGSDSIMYFQWRKSRGSFEKFHGAVIDHDGSSNNRVFQEVTQVGQVLEQLSDIVGTMPNSDVAILYDWENNWAINDAQGFGKETKFYPQTLQQHYQVFWNQDISVDVITKEQNFSKYKLLVVPMLYLVSEQTIDRLRAYVEQGGVLVMTYLSGIVNENDLTYLNGWPQLLQKVFGINVLEIDSYYPSDRNEVRYGDQNYEVKDYASVINVKEANVEGVYQADFYAKTAAITSHSYGKGKAYYVGARLNEQFHEVFYQKIMADLQISSNAAIKHEKGVSVQVRLSDTHSYWFVMNFTEKPQVIRVNCEVKDILSGEWIKGEVRLERYGFKIFVKKVG